MNKKIGQASARPSALRVKGCTGQASAELISIMGISLLVVLVFLILAGKSISEVSSAQNYNDARDAANSLAQAADSVFAQGEGASRTVFIKLPANSVSYMQSNSIIINLDGSDIITQSTALLSGSLPSSPGSYNMKIVSHGSYVLITPYLADIDKKAIFISMARTDERQENLKIFSAVSAVVRADANASWGFTDVILTVSPSSLVASPSGSQINLTFSSAGGSPANPGFHNSQLVINATSDTNLTETFYVPITLYVNPG